MTKYCDGTTALTPCPHPEDCTISCEFNNAVVLRKISTALAAARAAAGSARDAASDARAAAVSAARDAWAAQEKQLRGVFAEIDAAIAQQKETK